MQLLQLQIQFSVNLAKLILYAHDLGYQITMGECYRTKEQQKIYFDNGASKTMNSYHLIRLACDINLFKDSNNLTTCNDYKVLGLYWEQLHENNVWLGRTGFDADHFEMKFVPQR